MHAGTSARVLAFRAALFVVLGALGLPGHAEAQELGLDARVSAEVMAAVAGTLEAARRDSLPIASLESKVLEGVAKGVSADRIGVAVSALAGELRTARAALRAALPDAALADGEVASTALAVRHGVPADRLVTLWEHRGERGSLEIPFAVTGELTRRGIEPGAAVEFMSHILESRTSLGVAAQIPARLDFYLPEEAAPRAALLAALRSLGIPDPPRPGRPGGPGGPPFG